MKLSPAQTKALLSATFNPHARGDKLGAYVIHTMHGRTRNALHDMGLMTGHYYLTRKGVETLAALSGNVVDMYGYEWEGEFIVSVDTSTETEGNVTVRGEYVEPRTMVDPEGNTVPYDAFLSMAMQDAARIEADNGCIGLCAVGTGCEHCDTQYGPEASHTDAESVCTATDDNPDCLHCERVATDAVDMRESVQELKNAMEESNVNEFVFVPRTHALDMGTRGYNRFVGIGESQGVPGSLFTFGLTTAISAHPGMNGTGKTNIPCEYGDVITVRTSLGDVRYVVEDNRYSATGPRKGDPILTPYATDTQRCARCETFGDNSMPSAVIHGDYVCGYCVENTESDESDRFPCFKRMGVVTHKGECAQAHGVNGAVCSLEDDEIEDAGFVETDSTDDYAIVSRLSTGAGFHTVTDSVSTTPETVVSTGTTHHTMDTDGTQWERFDHVLSVGDVVKVVGSQGVYEVHCLIPGLPVVYVLGTQGEPFPVPATNVYAL